MYNHNRAATLLAHADATPEKVALLHEGRSWTFHDLKLAALQNAAALQRKGFRQGDRIGLLMSTCPEFIVLEFAAFILGGTVVPLNSHYTAAEIEHILVGGRLGYIVHEDEFSSRLQDAMRNADTQVRSFVLSRTSDPNDGLRYPEGWNYEEPFPALASVSPLEPALLLTTSATTGKAKLVVITAGNMRQNYDRHAEWLGVTRQDVVLGALPLNNTFGQNQCINLMAFAGMKLVLLSKFDAQQCLQAIEQHSCTFMPLVPTMLHKMLFAEGSESYDLSSLRTILVGGAPVPAELLRQTQKQIGKNLTVLTGYGLSESTALSTMHEVRLGEDGEIVRAKTVGKPVDGVDVEVRRGDGTVAAVGEVGEIVVRGPNVCAGYFEQPDETAKTIVDGWLYTGDLGTFDAEGYLFLIDRKKDLIIRGGANIYPAEVEEVLYDTGMVAEAGVIGQPDVVFGEVPVAFVVLKPGSEASVEILQDFILQRLARYKVPVAIHVLSELPKGPTGKILRRGLVQYLDRTAAD
ncbi:hypothetical protein AWV79_33975 [Cupriavidus sp. UYMMa02A]|nr:hypothetical protein AWV79_33975 [Cupriavidus sp. UYMMa02A]